MKKLLVIVLLLAVTGCSGVWMNAEYSQLLDKTAVLSKVTAERAEQGRLTGPQMVDALGFQATTWQKFADARDGVSDGD